jgi:hypothetical protein
MAWLFDSIQDPATARKAPHRRGRVERVRHFLKVRRARAKSAWKKLSKRVRRIVLGALAMTALAVAGSLLMGPPRKEKSTIYNLVPPTEEPVIPEFKEETLSIDTAAPRRKWKYIVVHHSASSSGSAQSFDQYHREENHWRSLGYHFVIGNGRGQGDGVIAAGPRWYGQEAGAHAHSTEHNEFGIGICLVGNFDAQNPSAAQWQSLVKLVKRLGTEYHIPPGNIVGHNQIRQGGSTACPGKNLNLQALREAVE